MNFRKIIKVASRQLLVNSSKSIWAVAGLSIGVAAVITMVAVGNGAKTEAISQLEKLGTNLITINAGKVRKVMERRQNTDMVSTLKMRDCQAILNECPSVREVVPSLSGQVKVKSGDIATSCMVNGVSGSYFKVKNFTFDKGDSFSAVDDLRSQRIAVLGGQISQTLFGTEDPIGKIVLVKRIPFVICGVLTSKGVNTDGANLDNEVYIPINTAMRRIFNLDYIQRMFIEVNSREALESVGREIEVVLRNAHKLNLREKENDFTIDNQLNDLKTLERSSTSFTWLIAGVSAIALFIGSIGILAVMLLSVKERNAEIGLRLSVGAKRKDIVSQFLAEAAILGLAGGLAGFLVSLLLSFISSFFTEWHIVIVPGSVIISLAFSLVVGLASGVFPARKASLADPILALQKE